MTNQGQLEIVKIQAILNNKRDRSEHPITMKVAELIRMARRNPAGRQEHVEKALALLPHVPKSDNVHDLAQKLKNEASKDLVGAGNPNYTSALKAVKICDMIIAPEIDELMVIHAGSGTEGILRKENIVKKTLPKSEEKTSGKKEEMTTTDLMLAYAGS